MHDDYRPDRPAHLANGLIRPSILAHLIGRSAHGYELRGQLLAVGLECDLGTVYRALNTMEDEGLVRSTWERSAGGRHRRRYELTEVGAEMVEVYAETVTQVLRVANSFLEMRRSGGRPGDDDATDGAAPPALVFAMGTPVATYGGPAGAHRGDG